MTTNADTTPHLAARPTTIVWGSLLLVVAAIAIFGTTGGFDFTGPSTVLWLVVGGGGILIVGALVGGIANAVRRRQPATSATVASGRAPESGQDATAEFFAADHQPID